MNVLIAKLGGKKFLTTFVGVVAVILTATGVFEMTPEMQAKVVECLSAITGAATIAQGIADGLSQGKTSSNALLAKYDKDGDGKLSDAEKANIASEDR